MRVLHVSTTVEGGAGVAGIRLHRALHDLGVESKFLSQGESSDRDVDCLPMGVVKRSRQKMSTGVNRLMQNSSSIHFSPLSAGVIDVRDIERFRPAIVHVHNWFNFFSWKLVPTLQASGIHIVATLHDERLLTGGCHYSLECEQFAETCRVCPQSRLHRLPAVARIQESQRIAIEAADVTLIAPSAWLCRNVALWGHLTHRKAIHIPNCIDADHFGSSSRNGEEAREVSLGFVLGKAPELLQETLRELGKKLGAGVNRPIELVIAGEGQSPIWKHGSIRRVGRIDTDDARASFWSMADMGLFVTQADNFPNVILEGLASGVPQVVVDVGGAPEAVYATAGGLVVPPDPQELASALYQLAQSPDKRWRLGKAARDGVLAHYSPAAIADKHLRVYESLVRES